MPNLVLRQKSVVRLSPLKIAAAYFFFAPLILGYVWVTTWPLTNESLHKKGQKMSISYFSVFYSTKRKKSRTFQSNRHGSKSFEGSSNASAHRLPSFRPKFAKIWGFFLVSKSLWVKFWLTSRLSGWSLWSYTFEAEISYCELCCRPKCTIFTWALMRSLQLSRATTESSHLQTLYLQTNMSRLVSHRRRDDSPA